MRPRSKGPFWRPSRRRSHVPLGAPSRKRPVLAWPSARARLQVMSAKAAVPPADEDAFIARIEAAPLDTSLTDEEREEVHAALAEDPGPGRSTAEVLAALRVRTAG